MVSNPCGLWLDGPCPAARPRDRPCGEGLRREPARRLRLGPQRLHAGEAGEHPGGLSAARPAPARRRAARPPQPRQGLPAITKDGADGFYKGQVAADIVAYLRSLGGYHDIEDFAAHKGEFVEPISTRFHGHDVYECPPNGQGLAALVLVNLVGELLGDAPIDSAEGVHLLAEASKVAFALRDDLIADPAFADVPVAHWLSAQTTKALAGSIDRARAKPRSAFDQLVPDHPDTSYVTVVDRDGMAVSLISSIFHDFGSKLVEPNSSIVLHNRGASFRVQPGHCNDIAPGKRPMHTIIPGMVMEGDRIALSFGVVGGDYQPVGHAHLLHAILAEGRDPQEALNLPRSMCIDRMLLLETTHPGERISALAARGHAIGLPVQPIGGGQAIRIDHERGVLIGGTDSRRDGIVLGY